MARKPKTERVPRTRAGGEWTEAAFWSFLSSVIRSGSRRWPPIVRQARAAVRREYRGPNKRQKWEYYCRGCGDWFSARDTHVDHIEPVGRLRSYEDIEGVIRRLYCEADNLQVLCEDCHQAKTRGVK